MNGLIIKAPGTRRIGSKILPIGSNDEFHQPRTPFSEQIRIVDKDATAIEGQLTGVLTSDIVEDTGASFTPDLVGKVIYRLTSTANTNTDGTVARAPEDGAFAIISQVISGTRLRLNRQIFTGTSSKYYAIDNHTGKILTSVDGFITTDSASKIIDANASFVAGYVGKYALVSDGQVWFRALITSVDSSTQITLEVDLNTTVGRPYKIILTDDAYRFVNSGVNDLNYEYQSRCHNVVIKDGTYRESIFIPPGGQNIFGNNLALAIIGDMNQGAKTILKGSYSTAPTTRVLYAAVNATNITMAVIGMTLSYFTVGAIMNYVAVTFDQVFFQKVSYGTDASIDLSVSISNSRFDTMTSMLIGQGNTALQIGGAITVDTNISWISQYTKGIGILIYDNPTISGAGTVTMGTSFQGIFGGHWNGATNVPNITDGSGIWEKYFATSKTAATATAGAAALPANPEGFIVIYVNGVQKKIPYYTA